MALLVPGNAVAGNPINRSSNMEKESGVIAVSLADFRMRKECVSWVGTKAADDRSSPGPTAFVGSEPVADRGV